MKQQGNRNFWKDKAIKLHSYWIRQRHIDDEGKTTCVTCNTPGYWKRMDCGHFMIRKHESTFFDERNSHAQCVSCNNWGEGQQYKHAKAIDNMYGKGTAEALEIKSKQPCKRDWFDYYYIAKEFHDKIVEAGFELPPGTKTLFK